MTFRALIAIPHYFDDRPTSAPYGSMTQTREQRRWALQACLAALFETFGPTQCQFHLSAPLARPVNAATSGTLDIVICTSGEQHVLKDMGHFASAVEHRPSNLPAKHLGWECHQVFAERLGAYDYYGYLEDDLVIHDPCWFVKLTQFREQLGDEKLLLPQRYERRREPPFLKAYIDGPLNRPCDDVFNLPTAQPQEIVTLLDMPVLVRRPANPHAGCFFLSESQMSRWSSRPYFLDQDTSFVGPLESAATLGIAKTFAIYKPAERWGNFFEIEHAGATWIERLAGR